MDMNTPAGHRATDTVRALVTAYLEGGPEGPLYQETLTAVRPDFHEPEVATLLVAAAVELASVMVESLTPDDQSGPRTPDGAAWETQALVAMTSEGLRMAATPAGKSPFDLLASIISLLKRETGR